MLKIGDFSRLAHVSVKTLRHYGRLGLLKPAWIDRFSGYRYYTPDQLAQLNRILLLKDLSFSLDQIRQLMHKDIPAAELRGMVRLKQSELERQVQAQREQLARVETFLRQIEQEGMLPSYEVVLKQVPPLQVIGIRQTVPSFQHIGPLFGELFQHLEQHNASPAAIPPPLAIYFDVEYRDRGVDVEAAVPISRPVPSAPRIAARQLAPIDKAACLVFQGAYEGLSDGYRGLLTWTEANGYSSAGPGREIYLHGPGQTADPAEYVTELQLPVTRKPIYSIAKKESSEMEPKIVTKPAFTVVGMLYHGKNENNEIAQLWGVFSPRIPEIQHVTDGAFGVCDEPDESGAFKYLAGMAVSSTAEIPAGMVSWEVPAQTYAVFPCSLQNIGEAYRYAHDTWIPQSGYQCGDGPDYEYYDEEYDPAVEGSLFTIYIPIKK